MVDDNTEVEELNSHVVMVVAISSNFGSRHGLINSHQSPWLS